MSEFADVGINHDSLGTAEFLLWSSAPYLRDLSKKFLLTTPTSTMWSRTGEADQQGRSPVDQDLSSWVGTLQNSDLIFSAFAWLL